MVEEMNPDKREAIISKIKQLESTLTGILYDDLSTIQTVRNLKAKVGLYHCEFDDSGCVYCSG